MGEQSSSRLEGDRYQHLFSWYLILDNLGDPSKEVEYIWLEHPDAGAADDITIHPRNRGGRYYQIKWHVDQRAGYSMESLIAENGGNSSLLWKLWNAWCDLQSESPVEIWLVSNWACVPDDPLGQLIRSRNYKLDTKFLQATPNSTLGRWKKRWQNHLKADEKSFEEFFTSLRFRLGFLSISDLYELVDKQMQFLGFKSGESFRSVAIDQVKEWIEEGGTHKKITRAILLEMLEKKGFFERDGVDTGIVVAIHTWSTRKHDIVPSYELNWTAHFDHKTRRTPDSDIWNGVLIPELRSLEQLISQSTTCRRIKLRGSLCLSAAIAFGHVFSVAAGYQIELQHRTQIWFSATEPDPDFQIQSDIQAGNKKIGDIIIVCNVTGKASADVVSYAQKINLSFCSLISICPALGPSDNAIRGVAQAATYARQTRLIIRQAITTYQPELIHLFYFGPQSLAVLLGQKINACGKIQLYEYQNPGYIRSCILT